MVVIHLAKTRPPSMVAALRGGAGPCAWTEAALVDFGFEGLLKAAEEEIGPWARKLIVWGALIGVITI